MDDMFEEVLAICLDRLSDGDSVESCVADFPECPELEPLLDIAAVLSSASEDAHRRTDRTPKWLKPRQSQAWLRPTG
jgi:hypothetical protein